MAHSTQKVKASDGTELHVEMWTPEGAPKFAVLLAHGLAEHMGRYDQVARELNGYGALVFGPDHRGQGRSGGLGGHVEHFDDHTSDLKDVCKAIAASLPKEQQPDSIPWFLVAHSTGALIGLLFLHDHAPSIPIRGAVLSAPLLEPAVQVNPLKVLAGKLAVHIAPKLRMDTGIPEEHISRDPEQVRLYKNDPRRVKVVSTKWFEAMNNARARAMEVIPSLTLPMLWYYGAGDKIVSPSAVASGFARLKNPGGNDQQLKRFEGYFHELHNEPAELRKPVIEMIGQWLVEHAGSSRHSQARSV
jgi:alpha-beta hydrolase superfamily lysophospholipase